MSQLTVKDWPVVPVMADNAKFDLSTFNGVHEVAEQMVVLNVPKEEQVAEAEAELEPSMR